jgi:hypothetical protein
MRHEATTIFEKNVIILLRRHHADHGLDRRPRRRSCRCSPGEHDREGGGHAPLHAARAGRPQHLRPRGLLHLPQPDDPPVPRRVERYGHYSLAAESMYDHPFQWGSKRTGPDLARVGGKYSDDWHVAHMIDPRSVVPESIMPPYPSSPTPLESRTSPRTCGAARVGVPYTDEMIANAVADLEAQANPDADPAPGCRALPRPDRRLRRRPGEAHRDGRADRLSADAGHAGRFRSCGSSSSSSGSRLGLLARRTRSAYSRRGRIPLRRRRAVRSRTLRSRGCRPRSRRTPHRHRHHRPRVGRHQGAEHAAAEMVALDLLRHHRLGGRLRHLYPAWPGMATPACRLDRSRGDRRREDRRRAQQRADLTAHREADADEIRADPDCCAFALAGGASPSPTTARRPATARAGRPAGGYPSLADDDWIWGGSSTTSTRHPPRHPRRESDDSARA